MISPCVARSAGGETRSARWPCGGPIRPRDSSTVEGAQTELRALRGHAEQQTRQKTGHHQHGSVSEQVQQGFDHLKALDT